MIRSLFLLPGLLAIALLVTALSWSFPAGLAGSMSIIAPMAIDVFDFAFAILPVAAMAGAVWWLLNGGAHRFGAWCLELKRDLSMRWHSMKLPTVRRSGGYGPLLA